MNFLVIAALLVAGLVAAPIVAHLLGHGKVEEQEFPPARLVRVAVQATKKKIQSRDRLLLLVRALMICGLAMLGATPLTRCSRLSLSRDSGASVALAILIDDSMSMKSTTADGSTRFAISIAAAEEILDSAREGDSVSIVLAGKPARVALSHTSNLGRARDLLAQLSASDRSSDVDRALGMAHAALQNLPHIDKRVVAFSDFAGSHRRSPGGFWSPLSSLTTSAANCGIVEAALDNKRIRAVVACNDPKASEGRTLELRSLRSGQRGAAKLPGVLRPEAVLNSHPLEARAGVQRITLDLEDAEGRFTLSISGTDSLTDDDDCDVFPGAPVTIIGVVADPAHATPMTGGATVIEQAIAALNRDVEIRPLGLVPDDSAQLRDLALLIVDDPAGLDPNTRAALDNYLKHGGVLLGLLGPNASTAQLSTNLEPFLIGAPRWEKGSEFRIDAPSLAWLGVEARSLDQIAREGRSRLDGAELPDSEVIGSWDDQVPFALRRQLGSGQVVTIGLPASLRQSDFSLRPAFVALLADSIDQAVLRRGPRRTPAGEPWHFPATGSIEIEGPQGTLELQQRSSASCPESDPACDTGAVGRVAIPEQHGVYEISLKEETQQRLVVLSAAEIIDPPQDVPTAQSDSSATGPRALVDASGEFALALLALLALDLALRRRHQIRALDGAA